MSSASAGSVCDSRVYDWELDVPLLGTQCLGQVVAFCSAAAIFLLFFCTYVSPERCCRCFFLSCSIFVGGG